MGTESIKAKLIANSKKQSQWVQDANWRKKNEEWLDISFSIAVKILSALKAQDMSQKTLAEHLDCSAQYVNKLLKGGENLQLETICKIQTVLNIKLITVPNSFRYNAHYHFDEALIRHIFNEGIKKDSMIANTKSANIVQLTPLKKDYVEAESKEVVVDNNYSMAV